MHLVGADTHLWSKMTLPIPIMTPTHLNLRYYRLDVVWNTFKAIGSWYLYVSHILCIFRDSVPLHLPLFFFPPPPLWTPLDGFEQDMTSTKPLSYLALTTTMAVSQCIIMVIPVVKWFGPFGRSLTSWLFPCSSTLSNFPSLPFIPHVTYPLTLMEYNPSTCAVWPSPIILPLLINWPDFRNLALGFISFCIWLRFYPDLRSFPRAFYLLAKVSC